MTQGMTQLIESPGISPAVVDSYKDITGLQTGSLGWATGNDVDHFETLHAQVNPHSGPVEAVGLIVPVVRLQPHQLVLIIKSHSEALHHTTADVAGAVAVG